MVGALLVEAESGSGVGVVLAHEAVAGAAHAGQTVVGGHELVGALGADDVLVLVDVARVAIAGAGRAGLVDGFVRGAGAAEAVVALGLGAVVGALLAFLGARVALAVTAAHCVAGLTTSGAGVTLGDTWRWKSR